MIQSTFRLKAQSLLFYERRSEVFDYLAKRISRKILVDPADESDIRKSLSRHWRVNNTVDLHNYKNSKE